ncbi:MAG: PD-(D/E)XK nuclease family protein, partial [Candidatus Margulisiibacteriota bacterium]
MINELYFSQRQKEFLQILSQKSEILLAIHAPAEWMDPVRLRQVPPSMKELSLDQIRLNQITHYKVPNSFIQLIQAIDVLDHHHEIKTLIDTDFYEGAYPMLVNPDRFLFQRFTSFSQTPFYRWLKTWARLIETRCERAWSIDRLYEAACWPDFSAYYSWENAWKNELRSERSKGKLYVQTEKLYAEPFRNDAERILKLKKWPEWKAFLTERAEQLVEDPFHSLTWQGYFATVVQLDILDDEGFLHEIDILAYLLDQLALVSVALPAGVPEERTVRVESLMNSRNVSEETVLLLNMTEGRIPTPRRAQFLFSENQRKRLGLKTYEDILQRERYNFMQKVLSAKQAILFSIENEEENLTTSSFVEELLLAFPSLRTSTPLLMREEVFQKYLALFGNENAPVGAKSGGEDTQDDLPRRQAVSRTNLSYSAFASLQTCAYQFGLRYDYAFRPGERQTSRELKASTLGLMIHDLFNQLGEEISKRLSSEYTLFTKLSQQIPYEKLIRITYERYLLYIPPSWRIRYFEEILLPILKESMQVFVEETLGARFSPTQISRLHLEEKTPVIQISDTLSLEARADLRLETHEGAAWIIDFKTGAQKDRQQLDFYELYYYGNSSSFRVKEKLFYNVLESHCDFPITDQLLSLEVIEKEVHSLRSEAYYPRTTARSRCLYCDYQAI